MRNKKEIYGLGGGAAMRSWGWGILQAGSNLPSWTKP